METNSQDVGSWKGALDQSYKKSSLFIALYTPTRKGGKHPLLLIILVQVFLMTTSNCRMGYKLTVTGNLLSGWTVNIGEDYWFRKFSGVLCCGERTTCALLIFAHCRRPFFKT